MVAYVPGRRRTARSGVLKWCSILVNVAIVVIGVGAAGLAAYEARPAHPPVILLPAPIPATAVPYRPAGPDLSLPPQYSAPLRITLGPRTALAVTLHLGPSENYVVLGTLQTGAPLKVIGRDKSGAWLAVVFPPNSTFRAWLRLSQTLDVKDIQNLPVVPVRFLR